MTLDWVPEKFPPSGGLAAEGFSKLLGRPKLDPLAVLVRETAQNSWDARDGSGRPVRFRIDGQTLSNDVTRTLGTEIFANAAGAPGTGLHQVLSRSALTALYISDRNTKGLGGPVQANHVDPQEIYDWVDFVLNVGKANTAGQTGGTYGFGKTISYVVSQARTIVIHTRALHMGHPVTRLIGSAIGDQFALNGTLCTGRHWWGRSLSGGPVPVEGAEADSLAAKIGMPPFEDDEFGTNILILAPDFGGRSPRQGMTFIAESILWHLWPKFLAHDENPPMTFAVTLDGSPVPIPRPEERPPLSGFANAFREIASNRPSSQRPVGMQHDLITRGGKTVVGELATVPFVSQPRVQVDDGHDPEDMDSPRAASPFNDRPCHHVALLRSPELVVEYREGPPAPEGGMEWAGVFRGRDEFDRILAEAEPPTHDSWQPELVTERRHKLVVSKCLRDITKVVNNRWGTTKTPLPAQAGSTAVIADALGHIIGPIAGHGPGKTDGPAPGSRVRRDKAKVQVLSSGPLMHNGHPATHVRLSVMPKKHAQLTRLWIEIGVALDGSSSDPTIDRHLRLVSSAMDDHTQLLSGHQAYIDVPGDSPREVSLLAERSAFSSILWNIQAEECPDEETSV